MGFYLARIGVRVSGLYCENYTPKAEAGQQLCGVAGFVYRGGHPSCVGAHDEM